MIAKLFDLTEKNIVVVGGAGILGSEFCNALAACGAHVAIVDMDGAAADVLRDALMSKYNCKCISLSADITDPDQVRQMTDTIEEELGPIDVLLNNAASKGKDLKEFFEPLETYSADVWKEVMDVNLNGMFYVAREIGIRMAKRKKGSIIQTSSIYGVVAPDQRIYEGSEYMGMSINTPAIYSASKAGVIGLTKYLASYWANDNVRVNTLTPGGMQSGQNQTFINLYSNRVPLGRMGKPEELIGAIIYLASDASSYMTGQNLIIDGGLTVW